MPTPAQMAASLQGGESGPALSGREAAVCVGIVTRHSNEAIALHLDLSINSVRTYRRRAYAKLQITSQNELFALILNGGSKRPILESLNPRKPRVIHRADLPVCRFGALSYPGSNQDRQRRLPNGKRLSLEIAALGDDQTLVVKRRLLLIG
jgi:DNA-binding CsgD family transcriptional regulator